MEVGRSARLLTGRMVDGLRGSRKQRSRPEAPCHTGQDTHKLTGACTEELSACQEDLCRQDRRVGDRGGEARGHHTSGGGRERGRKAGSGARTVGGASPDQRTMLSSALQILAFALALLGVLGATVATVLPNWKVSVDIGNNIMTAISQMQGLWMDCTWYSTGVFSCTLKHSVLSLPACLQTARTTMVLSCMMASLGLCLATLGLKCTRWGGSHRAKGHTAIAAGGCFVLASVLCLVPASWFTNEVITSFLDANVPESSKYEPGGAVYVTFISAGFLLAGGIIFCLSCPGRQSGHPDFAPSGDPDKLLQRREKLDQEQLRREEREREQQRHRPQTEQKEEEGHGQKTTNLGENPAQPQTEGVHQQEKPSQDKAQQEPKKQCCSPAKLSPKDIRARYNLHDYV